MGGFPLVGVLVFTALVFPDLLLDLSANVGVVLASYIYDS